MANEMKHQQKENSLGTSLSWKESFNGNEYEARMVVRKPGDGSVYGTHFLEVRQSYKPPTGRNTSKHMTIRMSDETLIAMTHLLMTSKVNKWSQSQREEIARRYREMRE